MTHEKQEINEEAPVLFKSTGTIVKELSIGTIVFHNTGMISEKLIEIMCLGIENGGFNNEGLALMNVIFRHDGFPIPNDGDKAEWMYFPDSYTAVCNVKHLINIAIDNTQNEEEKLYPHIGMKCVIWRAFLTGFFHECSHAMSSLSFEGGHIPEEKLEKEEQEADEAARNIIFSLAKEYNLEIDFSNEMNTYIDIRIDEEINTAAELADEDKDKFLQKWVDLQTYLRDNNGTCYIPEEDCEDFFLATFKDFLFMASGDAEDDPEWLKETIAVPTTLSTTTTNEINIHNPTFDGGVNDIPDFTEKELIEDVPFIADPIQVAGMEGVNIVIQPQQIITPNTAPINPIASAQPTSVGNQPIVTTSVAPGTPATNTNINPQVIVGANMYQAATMDTDSFQATIKGLYLKIFSHIFTNCGFNPTGTPPFVAGHKITENIPLSEAEKSIVKEMICYNAESQKMPGTKVENFISGVYIDKANTLPGFDLVLSDMNGAATTRRFIPQNPNKMKTGTNELSITANLARQGHQFMWIINPDSTDKQFAVRVRDGVVESNTAGQWTAI